MMCSENHVLFLLGPPYKTLFLDLDETLIHTCAITENPDHIIKGKDDSGGEILVNIDFILICIYLLLLLFLN